MLTEIDHTKFATDYLRLKQILVFFRETLAWFFVLLTELPK